MTPKAVLFDCDGVLVDSEAIADEAIVDNLTRHGLRLTKAEVADLFLGGTIEEIGAEARRRGAGIPADWVNEMYRELHARLAEGCPLVRGIDVLLERLDRAGVACAVGSNGSREKMKITLGQNGLWERFETLMTSAHDDVRAKPAPDIYLRLTELLRVDPADAVVVDDSPTGCRAGLAAGIPTIGFAERTDPSRLATLGIPVVRTMSELGTRLGLCDDGNR